MGSEIVTILEDAVLPLLKAMVDEPSEVKIKIQKSEYQTVFVYITGKKADVGKVIGKEGRHAGAIRTLISAIGAKHKFRTIVEINAEQ